jgi:hypothetical protein
MTDSSGATIAVTTNGSTTFSASVPSTVSSLVTGEQVQVAGTTSNGTVTATSIRVGGGGFGGGGFGGGGSGNATNTPPGT